MSGSRILGPGLATLFLSLAMAGAPAAEPAAAPEMLLGRGSHLIDLNLGYGHLAAPGAPGGSFGFGVGFLHFPSDMTALGVDVTADRLGRRAPALGKAPADLELVSVLAQGLIHPPQRIATPYVGVGAGPYFFRSSISGDGRTGTHWGAMARAGVRMVGWRPILGLDFRHHWVFLNPDDTGGPAPGKKVVRSLSLKMTLSFLF